MVRSKKNNAQYLVNNSINFNKCQTGQQHLVMCKKLPYGTGFERIMRIFMERALLKEQFHQKRVPWILKTSGMWTVNSDKCEV